MYAPIYLGSHQGIFAAEGMELEISSMRTDLAIAALALGPDVAKQQSKEWSFAKRAPRPHSNCWPKKSARNAVQSVKANT